MIDPPVGGYGRTRYLEQLRQRKAQAEAAAGDDAALRSAVDAALLRTPHNGQRRKRSRHAGRWRQRGQRLLLGDARRESWRQLDRAIDDPAFHQQHVGIGEDGMLNAVDVTGDVSHR